MHPPLLPFLLERLPSFSALIPVAVAIAGNRYLDKPLKVIFWFIAISLLLIIINVYTSYHSINNLAVFHFYAIFEFAFILWFFSYYVDGAFKKAIIPLVSVFAVWCVVNFFFIQNGVQLNTYTRPVEALIIILYCLYYFNKQTQSENNMRWAAISANWITVALVIYYACNFFIFIFSNYFLKKGDVISHYFWKASSYILVIENLLFAIGFYKAKTSMAKKLQFFDK